MAQQKNPGVVNINIKADWDPEAFSATQPVNQLIVQNTPAGEIVLTLGFVDAPLTWGSPEEQLQQARALAKKGLKINPVARVVMTPQIARQLEIALSKQNKIATQKQLETLKTAPPVQ